MSFSPIKKDFFKKDIESFTAINLGNYYTKGLIVKAGKITDYFIEKSNDLSATLKKLLQDKKIPAKKVKVSLKNPSCLVRYFSFPKMDKKKLKQTLFYEINKFIPFSPDEVYFDFFILKENSPSEVLMLLAVAKKDYIDKILETFEKVNLKISEISLDSISLMNLFFANYGDDNQANTCILDMGHNFSTMTLLHKGVPFLTRDVKFSTKEILQSISRIKNLSAGEVEEWLLSQKKGEETFELVQDNISNLCKEMKSSFDYFEVNKGEHIDKLYLSGGLASLAQIEKPFIELLDIQVEVLALTPKAKSRVDISFSDKGLTPFKNSFSAGYGLIV